MRLSRLCSFLLTVAAVALATVGCGGTATLVDPAAVQQVARPRAATPGPVIVAATPTPAPPPRVAAKLLVTVKDVKRPPLGMGTLTATVEVSNPSPVLLNGTVTVTFTKKGEATDQVQTRSVTVAPNGQQVLKVTSETWFLEGATAEVVTDNGGYNPHGASAGTASRGVY